MCADVVYQKIIKISPGLSKLQRAKLGTFFETVYIVIASTSTV